MFISQPQMQTVLIFELVFFTLSVRLWRKMPFHVVFLRYPLTVKPLLSGQLVLSHLNPVTAEHRFDCR